MCWARAYLLTFSEMFVVPASEIHQARRVQDTSVSLDQTATWMMPEFLVILHRCFLFADAWHEVVM
jgi:hypothetical protein